MLIKKHMCKSLYTNQVCRKCSVKRKNDNPYFSEEFLTAYLNLYFSTKCLLLNMLNSICITGKYSSILKYWRHVTEMWFYKNLK